MSGGHFDYHQHNILDMAEEIESIIFKNKIEKTPEALREESWRDTSWYDKYRLYYNFSDNIIDKFREAVIKLKEAYVYAQRVDWLLSGDDGEDTFLERLKEDLTKLYGK